MVGPRQSEFDSCSHSLGTYQAVVRTLIRILGLLSQHLKQDRASHGIMLDTVGHGFRNCNGSDVISQAPALEPHLQLAKFTRAWRTPPNSKLSLMIASSRYSSSISGILVWIKSEARSSSIHVAGLTIPRRRPVPGSFLPRTQSLNPPVSHHLDLRKTWRFGARYGRRRSLNLPKGGWLSHE